jgi:hypothetical protein
MGVIGGFCSWSLRCGRRSNLSNGRVNVVFERLEINEIFLMGGSHVFALPDFIESSYEDPC